MKSYKVRVKAFFEQTDLVHSDIYDSYGDNESEAISDAIENAQDCAAEALSNPHNCGLAFELEDLRFVGEVI